MMGDIGREIMRIAMEFRPAVRENVNLLLAFAGPSGSGKTMSALRVAEGLAGGKPIFFLDTEARRALHYAEEFRFQHGEMSPPFRPVAFLEAIREAEKAGAGVIIIDSFSHEYDGEGGILDWAAEIEAGGTKPPGNWKQPKFSHKRLMNALLQCRAHLIFCLRADEKIQIVRENGKTQVIPLGWTPICEKRFMYEMTASFTLTADNPGKPNFHLPHKLQEQHRPMFPEGKFIDENAGRALAEWAAGGAPPAAKMPEDLAYVIAQGDEAAARGMSFLEQFWKTLSVEEKQAVGGKERLDQWKRAAEERKHVDN